MRLSKIRLCCCLTYLSILEIEKYIYLWTEIYFRSLPRAYWKYKSYIIVWKIVVAIVTQKVFTIYLEGNSQYWEISQKSVVETLRKI